MKLSEAIREGAKRRPQIGFVLFGPVDYSSHDKMIGSCVMGCLYEELFHSIDIFSKEFCSNWDKMKLKYPQLDEYYIHPEDKIQMQLVEIMIDLNNERDWTREQIADWLEKDHNL